MPSGSSSIIVGAGIEPILPLLADMPLEVANPTVPVSVRLAGDPLLVSAIEIGPQAQAGGNGAIAIGGFVLGPGAGPQAGAANSIAIGAGGASPDVAPSAQGGDGIAIGRGSTAGLVAGEVGCIGLGRQALARGGAGHQIAIGQSSSAQGANGAGISIGFQSEVGGNGRSISIGHTALTGFDTDNIAIGRLANAQGLRATCIGQGANVGVGNSDGVAIGSSSNVAAAATSGVALGRLASATAIGGVALGRNALADALDRAHVACSEFYVGILGSTRNRVLVTRRVGWGAPTGTATRTTFDTATVTLAQLAERVKALIDDLTTHGLIGA